MPESAANPDAMLDELEAEIEGLRVAYEKYFLGVDRAAPVRQRERLDRKLRAIEGTSLRTTVLRFRLGGLRARYITYAHYWTRILDQMERGVSRRDLAARQAPNGRAPSAAHEPTAQTTTADPMAAAPISAAPISAAQISAAPTLVDPDNVREVFDRLVAAKRSVGESIEGMTYAALLRKLSREAPKLAEQHGGRALRFDVEVRGGKVRVRARPE